METAYVTIVTAAGTSPTLVPQIEALDGVTEAHVVAGDFDIVVELSTDAVSDIMSLVTHEIQELDGVGHTRTYIVLDGV